MNTGSTHKGLAWAWPMGPLCAAAARWSSEKGTSSASEIGNPERDEIVGGQFREQIQP
jgi:hypothetical protein